MASSHAGCSNRPPRAADRARVALLGWSQREKARKRVNQLIIVIVGGATSTQVPVHEPAHGAQESVGNSIHDKLASIQPRWTSAFGLRRAGVTVMTIIAEYRGTGAPVGFEGNQSVVV